MALVFADRVKQIVTTPPGTGNFVFASTPTGFQSFGATIGNGNSTYYAAWDGAGNWEVGIGAYASSGTQLTRTTILSSSNGGSAVNFTTALTVWGDAPASKVVQLDASGNLSLGGTLGVAGALTVQGLLAGVVNSGNFHGLDGFGYANLPGGLIIQWGFVGNPGTGGAVVTLPKAFPNKIFCAFANVAQSGSAGTVANVFSDGTSLSTIVVSATAGAFVTLFVVLGN